MVHDIHVWLRYWMRQVAYCGPVASVAHRLARRGEPRLRAVEWDADLSGRCAAYLDESLSVSERCATAAVLLRSHGVLATSVLDAGCGSAQLAPWLLPLQPSRYVGFDISDVAVRAALSRLQNLGCAVEFRCDRASIEEFEPRPGETYDTIVFGEVLYYLTVPDALAQVERLSRFLSPGGAIVACMKDDAKSQAIWRRLTTAFVWIDGVLLQQKPIEPGYRIHLSRERPAYLVGLLRQQAPLESRSG